MVATYHGGFVYASDDIHGAVRPDPDNQCRLSDSSVFGKSSTANSANDFQF